MAITPRSLVHNWRLKLTAVGLSVFLWALVQAEPRDAEIFAAVPVVVEVADTAWAVSGLPDPAEVELRISGPAREMVRLARAGTSLRIPIREVGSTDTLVTVRRDWVHLGEGTGLMVESVTPSFIRVVFEPAVSRVVPINVRTAGILPPELALASPIGVNPPVARIRGPASRLEGVDLVRLRPLDLSRITASGVMEVQVDTVGLTGVRVVPGVATVGVRVEERVERTFSGIPVVAQPAFDPAELTIEPSRVDVVLQGALTLVTAVDSMDLSAWVTAEGLEGMAPGEERRVPVRLEGVPDLVFGQIPVEMVTVRRRSDAPIPGDGP